VDVVTCWTGSRADALRQALRMTNAAFAARLGVAARTVAYWRARPDVVPRPAMQAILDTALAQATDDARELFHVIVTGLGTYAGPGSSAALASADDDLASLTGWLTATVVGDQVIEQAGQAAATLAELHTCLPARTLLSDVLRMHSRIVASLRRGGQHLRQTRELLRVEGMVLAHAGVLFGDLGHDHAAARFGRAALLCLQESGASESPAWYALAKTARWQRHYASAAELASRGFQSAPVTPMGVQLASYEANSAALLGDAQRARDALQRSEMIAAALPADGSTSLWAFPAQRRAIFHLSVLLRTGDPDGALQAAADADRAWASGEPHIPGTWAQVRIGAAIAELHRGALDGAAEHAAPVLKDMAPEFRIATVTGWLADLDAQLAGRRYARSPVAVTLRREIRDFAAAALPSRALEAG
jgi:hypothetical protein